MKLFVPELGTRLKLLKPATFTIKAEERNQSLFLLAGKGYVVTQYVALPEKGENYVCSSTDGRTNRLQHWHRLPGTKESFEFTVPAGETLIVDRIYIRAGNSRFSSLTFKWKPSELNGKQVRFFVSLEEVNGIEVEVEPS